MNPKDWLFLGSMALLKVLLHLPVAPTGIRPK